jgi:hypothetical protein
MSTETTKVNWKRVLDFPVYDPIVMKSCADFDNSIANIQTGNLYTPNADHEIVSDDSCIGISLSLKAIPGITEKRSISRKQYIEYIQYCVGKTPRVYIWEHPDFFKVFNESIDSFCSNLCSSNQGLFVRTNRTYILSTGEGSITDGKDVNGLFSGMRLTVGMPKSSEYEIRFEIPKYVFNNKQGGSLSESTFVYTDSSSNLRITVPGSKFSLNKGSLVYTFNSSQQKNSQVKFEKIDSGTPISMPNNEADLLISKVLRIPITSFDFRFMKFIATP